MPGTMDIPGKLLQYRYHFAVVIIASVVLSLLLYAAPRLLTILTYFWPLFVSTIVFLVLIIAFGGVSQLGIDGHGQNAGESLIDYYAGRPEHTGDAERYE